MADFAQEKLPQVWHEILPLLKLNWEEVSEYGHFEPSYQAYDAASQLGILRIYTCREAEQIVGYCAFYVHPDPHAQNLIVAHADAVYIHPDSRGKLLGTQLLKFADEQLKNDGVMVVYHHVTKQHPQLGKLLEKLGYTYTEKIMGKEL